MEEIINIKNLNKKFGNITALEDINLSVYKGEMFGLVGPDGAGKTTLIRILCGIIKMTSGEIFMMGYDLKNEFNKIKGGIGYLSQVFSLYGGLSVEENMNFFAEIYGVENFESKKDELLSFTRLKQFRNRLAEKLSGGMKQKLALACTLIHKPQIVFLDEPTTGVDPISRRELWGILSELIKSGVTIFLTTPYLDEAERCSRVGLMYKSKIILCDSPINIKSKIKKQILEITCNQPRKASQIVKQINNIEDVQTFGWKLHITSDDIIENAEYIKKVLQDKNIEVLNQRIITPSLEDVFISLVNQYS
jgi:ABC-2 type transport system ATP-binding protein